MALGSSSVVLWFPPEKMGKKVKSRFELVWRENGVGHMHGETCLRTASEFPRQRPRVRPSCVVRSHRGGLCHYSVSITHSSTGSSCCTSTRSHYARGSTVLTARTSIYALLVYHVAESNSNFVKRSVVCRAGRWLSMYWQ